MSLALATDFAEDLAARAAAALEAELVTWPKPGLVSDRDRGSHPDMTAGQFRASIAALTPWFAALARAGRAGADMVELRRLGLAAEADMLRATGGRNTHRGALFTLGLLVAAAGRGAVPLGAAIARHWGADIRRIPAGLAPSHGLIQCRRHGLTGARGEAAAGLPSVYRVGLPALAAARRAWPDDANRARVACFFALLNAVEDTTLWHRGGPAGRALAGRLTAGFDPAAPDWQARAEAIHRAFVARRLTAGGVADLLAATLLVADIEEDPPWPPSA